MKRVVVWSVCCCLLVALFVCSSSATAASRSEEHEEYAKTLWSYVTDVSPYERWTARDAETGLPGPACDGQCRTYLNRTAATSLGDMSFRSLVVNEHVGEEENVLAVTVRVKAKQGYDARNDDWYWAHYLADGTLLKTSADRCPLTKAGYVTFVREGRVWVFPEASADLIEFCESGEPGKCAVLPGEGPGGLTLKGSDTETLKDYAVARCGFFVKIDEDGRLWVAKAGSEEAETVANGGEWAKRVIRPGDGPNGMTLNAPDVETAEEYLTAKAGFTTRFDDDRIWVFKTGSAELADFDAGNEPAKIAIKVGEGPRGMSVKSVDPETITNYLVAKDGFFTKIVDDRIWVFRPGSEALAEFLASGEPGKCAVRIGEGPLGMTVKSADAETIDEYLR